MTSIYHGISPTPSANALYFAIAYLQRYAVTTTLMEHHPDLICLTCWLLAVKASEAKVPLHCLVAVAQRQPHTPLAQLAAKDVEDQVRQLESSLAQKLNYEFYVSLPSRAMRAILIELQGVTDPAPPAVDDEKSIMAALLNLWASPAQLQMAPVQLCLAALGRVRGVAAVAAYLQRVQPEASSEALARAEAIAKKVEAAAGTPPPDSDFMRLLDKVDKCLNPFLDPRTPEFATLQKLKREKAKRSAEAAA
ncbi:uncharacterized protein MONBRDRAFT_26082 [Monosiga brevicollis MX1]|uniref:Cyclin N-terminal domain-containing protein n=1 Tax=Monosiga brevicollis TaxID=81824 RepID=A9V1B5_MONBE|nr:uncharacterized protein MONBRDRAFT_26082 [Monosiga brevicollis MX1]EDQ88778.1 predicted protein [Monosiga brevicollis MX1]|eukprot:XP_001746391.1 hypothetical protein [Monosiga brevicollis MX1]